jgi:two-component system sensor histidine kinase KdpD
LLENIAKYTPPEAHVVISTQIFEDRVELAIADDGPGFSEEPDQLFKKFYRGDSAGPIPGAGLGLAICRAILEAHHGHIRAERGRPRGAVFILSLPRPTQASPITQDEDAS